MLRLHSEECAIDVCLQLTQSRPIFTYPYSFVYLYLFGTNCYTLYHGFSKIAITALLTKL